MDIAVVQFPGSNCERETIQAIRRVGMNPVPFLWNESPTQLIACDGYVIVGGFSYEDRSRAGIIAALDPVIAIIKQECAKGKPVLGICNGAQILVETGLVPGLVKDAVSIALADNLRIQDGQVQGTGYYNAWVHLKKARGCKVNAFTRFLPLAHLLRVPVAHAEGRFLIPADLLSIMQKEGLIVLQYCDAEGEIIEAFPVNPNGSVDNIAAITNHSGNVMAMMPHPERIGAGDCILESMREYIKAGYAGFIPQSLDYSPKPHQARDFKPQPSTRELIYELIINDNHAISVEQALKRLGVSVSIKRQIHWEIECDSEDTLHQVQASGLLYNENKEHVIDKNTLHAPYDSSTQMEKRSFLVRTKDDIVGLKKIQQLDKYFPGHSIMQLKRGILWHVYAERSALDAIAAQVIHSNILHNPISCECYDYV
jgi:phosphoribosylformylglycinamidine synthase